MITLYSYPKMFGLPDNNPFGLKVDTYLRLVKIDYKLEHTLDTKKAPRGQLPYILDDDTIITDSNYIIYYLAEKYDIKLDTELTDIQKNVHFLITRTLDNHLYWVMSYSRWQDKRFWPFFKTEFLKQYPDMTQKSLEQARKYNTEKYYYQGTGRCDVNSVYQSGIDDLKAISFILGNKNFIFGKEIHSIDACCYGFLANIFYFDIDTPLKEFITTEITLQNYVKRIRGLLNY